MCCFEFNEKVCMQSAWEVISCLDVEDPFIITVFVNDVMTFHIVKFIDTTMEFTINTKVGDECDAHEMGHLFCPTVSCVICMNDRFVYLDFLQTNCSYCAPVSVS